MPQPNKPVANDKPKIVIGLRPKQPDINRYLDINKTEFTVRKRPIGFVVNGRSAHSPEIYDNYRNNNNYNNDELYDVKSLDGRLLYDKYRTASTSNDRAPSQTRLFTYTAAGSGIGGNGGSNIGLLTPAAQPFSNFTSQTSLNNQVTSFTVDRAQMLRNFQNSLANRKRV